MGIAQGISAQRRYLNVLIADISDSTRLAASLEAEHYGEIVREFRRICRNVIPAHAGRIVQWAGDGVLAIFGYPQVAEDDGRRATEAALDLHAAVRSMHYQHRGTVSVGLHTGIHAGQMLIDTGDLELGTVDLVGRVPHVASRLSKLATFDQIFVSEESLGAAASFFVTNNVRRLTLRGYTHPICAYHVLDRAPIRNRFEARALRGLTPFVGRQLQMELLQQHWHATLRGESRFVVIEAEPGMGKTRLVEEFLMHAANTRCHIQRGYCENYLGAEPLQPFLQMLRDIFGMSRRMSAAEAAAAATDALLKIDPTLLRHHSELLRLLSISVSPPLVQSAQSNDSVAALLDVFTALAMQRSLLLSIDDWQWADDASRQVLRSLSVLAKPIMILTATRHPLIADLQPIQHHKVILEPLSVEACAAAIARWLPGAAPFVASEIHSQAGGNPLFVEELCHLAAAEGATQRFGRLQGSAAWLNSLIEARVARLSPEQAATVRTAAVIGNVFPAWLLERLVELDRYEPHIKSLADEDFIFPIGPGDMLRFKHGITRDAIYHSVGLHERRAIHRRVAEALHTQSDAMAHEEGYGALAHHYAGAGHFAEAAHFSELAGNKALASSALDRARLHYRAALTALDELADSLPDVQIKWVAVLQKLGMACVYDPLGFDDEPALFERGVALAQTSGDSEALARAEYWLGYFYYSKGYAYTAQTHCERGLELALRLGDEKLAAQIRATLGQAFTAASNYDRGLQELNAALDVKRALGKKRSSIAVGSAYTLSCKGLLLGDRGQFVEAHECFAEALGLIGGSSHQVESSVLGWVSTVHLWQGRWQEAEQAAATAEHIADLVRSTHLFAMDRALGGYASWRLSSRPQAVERILDATTWIEARKGKVFISLNYGWLADCMAARGCIDLSRRYAARAIVRARQGDRLGEAMAYRALAQIEASSSQLQRAEHYLKLASRAAQARGSNHEQAVNLLCHASVYRSYDRHRCNTLLDRACTAFEQMSMHWHLRQAQALQQISC